MDADVAYLICAEIGPTTSTAEGVIFVDHGKAQIIRVVPQRH
jgi:hypothetical protein